MRIAINKYRRGDRLKTSEVDVGPYASKVDPRTVRIILFVMAVDPINRGIQIKRKELAKTRMMLSNWKKPFGLHVFFK